ncbi:C-type lectin domain family 2 member A-like [Paroedura picta]|uniref:C-type lectin domain family 2 member A-like n=1 Tax=Paroedura picta TaxID=143630 RepID=UPI004056BE4F
MGASAGQGQRTSGAPRLDVGRAPGANPQRRARGSPGLPGTLTVIAGGRGGGAGGSLFHGEETPVPDLLRGKMDVEHNASEMAQLDHLVPNGQQNNSDPGLDRAAHVDRRNVLSLIKGKWKIWLLICSVVLNIILVIILVKGQQSHPMDSKTTCPPNWPLINGTCFYFSSEERNRTSSQEFCSLNDSSLAKIENVGKDMICQKGNDQHWIGLRKIPGAPWKWLDGQVATWEVLGKEEGEGETYAYWDDDGKAYISRGSTEHHWICSRPATTTGI